MVHVLNVYKGHLCTSCKSTLKPTKKSAMRLTNQSVGSIITQRNCINNCCMICNTDWSILWQVLTIVIIHWILILEGWNYTISEIEMSHISILLWLGFPRDPRKFFWARENPNHIKFWSFFLARGNPSCVWPSKMKLTDSTQCSCKNSISDNIRPISCFQSCFFVIDPGYWIIWLITITIRDL